MTEEVVSEFFNKSSSASYDEKQQRVAPIVDNLHLLIGMVLKCLPAQANILCVGVGTGAEIIKLAKVHPNWTFTGIEPSADMLDVCRTRLLENGILARTKLVQGYLSDFTQTDKFDAVLCLLVTHFVTDDAKRQKMFDEMAARLNPNGYLINADISGDMASAQFHELLEKWKALQMSAGSTPEQVENILPTWQKHLAILPPASIESFLHQSGFSTPVQFYQSFFIHAWYSQKK